MRFIQGTDWKMTEPAAVTLGKFDGIHLGHQVLLQKVQTAKEKGLKSVVFTFQIPPRAFTQNSKAKVLSTIEEKRRYLEKLGVDYLIEYPFNQEVCEMSPLEFVKNILINQLNTRYLAVGSDYHFGYKRAGDARFLVDMSKEFDYSVDVVDKLCDKSGREISSTYIREALAEGDMELVGRLLGRKYSVLGEIIHGNHLGRTFGMPTINQLPEEEKQLPPNGVYVSRTIIDQVVYGGVTNIGQKPTIEGHYPTGLETYIFGLNEDLYGRIVEVELVNYVREEIKFASTEALLMQMQRDADKARTYLFHNTNKE